MADLIQPTVPTVDSPTTAIPPTATMPGVVDTSVQPAAVPLPTIQAEPSPLIPTSASNVPLTVNVPVKAIQTPVNKQDTNSLIQQNQQISQASTINPVFSYEDAVQKLNQAKAALNNYDTSIDLGASTIQNRIEPITEQQGQLEALGRQTSITRSALARAVDAYTGYVQAAQAQREYEQRVLQSNREYELSLKRFRLESSNSALDNEYKRAQINKLKKEIELGDTPYNEMLSASDAQALGVPYGTTKGQAAQLSIVPQKPQTEAQKQAQGYADRLKDANDIFNSIQGEITKFGKYNYALQRKLPNWAPGKNSTIQQQEQAERNFINAVLRKESGAQVNKDEFKNYQIQYFPQPGDSQKVLDQKKANRERAMTNLYRDAGVGQTSGPSLFELERQVTGQQTSFNSGKSQIGLLSQKYESGGNPGAIGKDNTGGWSYGMYQLAHNNVDRFLSANPQFGKYFKGLAKGSQQFNDRWQQIARQMPEQFAAAQHKYIQQTHFKPQAEKLIKAGIDVNNMSNVVKDVIWSTAVQHGPNNSIVLNSIKKVGKNASDEQIIREIYKERWNGGRNFASSTPAVRQAVYNRFFGPQGEMTRALASLRGNTQLI
ncbi:MAG: hypothetical protein M3362_01310 [Acidobacteriota bacterium]|nr:hypothetical protein [Acidobacteriota bacterium]